MNATWAHSLPSCGCAGGAFAETGQVITLTELAPELVLRGQPNVFLPHDPIRESAIDIGATRFSVEPMLPATLRTPADISNGSRVGNEGCHVPASRTYGGYVPELPYVGCRRICKLNVENPEGVRPCRLGRSDRFGPH